MGNVPQIAGRPVSRLTLGKGYTIKKSLGELDIHEYWKISDEYRFHNVSCKLQPELEKSIELVYDCDLFIQQGPSTSYVLSVFNKSFVDRRRRRRHRRCCRPSFVPTSFSLPSLPSSSLVVSSGLCFPPAGTRYNSKTARWAYHSRGNWRYSGPIMLSGSSISRSLKHRTASSSRATGVPTRPSGSTLLV